MEDEATPREVGSNLGLGPAQDVRDNAQVMIFRWPDCTKLHIAKKFPGCFSGMPDMVWTRRLSDQETEAMLANPWRLFDKPEPNGQILIV